MKATARKIFRYIRIFLKFQKMNFFQLAAYRPGFFMMFGSVILLMILHIVFLKVVFGWVSEVKGWNFHEALIIVASAMIVDGAIWVSCAHFRVFQHLIRKGSLDSLLLKPVDSQFLTSVSRGDVEDFPRIFIGLILVIFGLTNLDFRGWELVLRFIEYIFLIFNACVITYSFSLILASIAFWTINTSNYALSDAVLRASQFPSDIFSHEWSKTLFSTVLPIALIATFPAKALVKDFDWLIVAHSTIVAVCFFFVGRFFFKLGLKKYSSASS
jgi:ABC-2 type transport system permease protein